jgi:hypothetical protein
MPAPTLWRNINNWRKSLPTQSEFQSFAEGGWHGLVYNVAGNVHKTNSQTADLLYAEGGKNRSIG